MGPLDRHSILRFLAFCQKQHIVCCYSFFRVGTGADVLLVAASCGEGGRMRRTKTAVRRDGRLMKWRAGLSPALCTGTCSLGRVLVALPLWGSSLQRGTQNRGWLRSLPTWGSLQPGKDPGCLAGPPWAWSTLGEGGGPCHGLGLCLHSVCPCKAPRFSQKAWCPPAATSPGGRVPDAQSEGPGQA